MNEQQVEGRHAVAEALRAGRPLDKLFVLDGCKDGPVISIVKTARKSDAVIQYVSRERLDQISETGNHQGVIACIAAYEYVAVEEILQKAREKGEPPFLFLLRDHPQTPGGGIDSRSRTGVGRGDQLHSSGACHQLGKDHRGVKKRGRLVRMRGYERHRDV